MKLFIPIFIFLITVKVFPSSISVEDTTAYKGNNLLIPVYGNFGDEFEYNEGDNVFRVEFEFDAIMLDIKNATTDENSVVDDPNINSNVILNKDDLRKSLVSVEFDTDLNKKSGILFYLDTEILAGPDTLANITPNLLLLNNVAIVSNFSDGIIKIPEPVSEIDKSFVSDFYPNPFHRFAKANLRLTKPTKIKIATYNINGTNVLSNICYDDCIEKHFRLIDENGITHTTDEVLEEGDYELELRNDYSTLSAGAYLLVIVTDYNVLTQRFVVIK